MSNLLSLDGNQLHLLVKGGKQLFDEAVKVLQGSDDRVEVYLQWDPRDPICPSLSDCLLQCVDNIQSISINETDRDGSLEEQEWKMMLENKRKELLLEMMLKAVQMKRDDVCRFLDDIFAQFSVFDEKPDILLEFYQRVKTQEVPEVPEILKSLFQSGPRAWSINLSEGKSSILLEVLKLQPDSQELKLTGCSHAESEVSSFLQCLPYIYQLGLTPPSSDLQEQTRFFMALLKAAAEREQQTGEKMLKMLSSACSYYTFPFDELETNYDVRCGFLLDLFSQMKDCETQTGLSLLPSFQPVFQSPPVWSIKLSERKPSILLEVLKLQSEKRPVELISSPLEESEVKIFLQCLPYISQLSLHLWHFKPQEQSRFFVDLLCAAAERDQQTGERMMEMLSSVCTYQTFPFNFSYVDFADEIDEFRVSQCDFLLDLYFQMKDSETKTGLSLLPSFQPVFQSVPAVWFINLLETKTSILLEVLKFQSAKKRVKFTHCSHEENQVRSLLQCLPYISALSLDHCCSDFEEQTGFFVNLFRAAAEREKQTGEKMMEMLSSVCSHQTFPLNEGYADDKAQCDFLLDLYSQMKDCETKTGLSLLPSLQPVFQSAPANWLISLSERKTSILLEVLKLQAKKKPVKLTDCSHEESEARIFLQCLPYISQLCLNSWRSEVEEKIGLLMVLLKAAAERDQQTGERMMETLSSVCSYQTFPLSENFTDSKVQSDFLLDLFSQMKDCETKTGLSLLPSLQPVFQLPPVWFISLSERKTSILLEVLKLQSEKKKVEVTNGSHDESEVRIFLQCLPYISQLRFILDSWSSDDLDQTSLVVNLFCAAAEREQQTGEKMMEMLASVCMYHTFPLNERYMSTTSQSDFLLDLFSQMKDCETKTGLSLLPSLQPVFQSPPVWFISLSERKTSILLEVLKLQSEKKPVKLTDCSHEESEVRIFLQCLPYISQLSLYRWDSGVREKNKLYMVLLKAAAEREQQTGEKMIEMLSSVCSHPTFPFDDKFIAKDRSDFLLDLYSQMKDCETKTGLSFLQCLPYISQLRASLDQWKPKLQEQPELFVNLIRAAAEREQQTGEKMMEILSSVCTYQTFPFDEEDFCDNDNHEQKQSDFLLDLYSQLSKTGLSLLPSLQPVFQSPPVWSINLSKRKTSILLEVLKLQSEKKKVEVTDCSHEESEVRIFLQCLPYISHLSVDRKQLLSFIHCCASSDGHQEAASDLLRTLQHSLDLSCSSCVELPEQEQTEALSLTAGDCRAVCTILRRSSQDTQLHLRDCEVEDSGLELLFPVLDRVRLRVSKTVLLQLLSLLPVDTERDTMRRAVSLRGALGGELDLSHTRLDQRLCGALVQMLDYCEELAELDLSHCQLTDQLLLQLVPHLHKVHVLDLSHNKISDAAAARLLQLVSINPTIQTVRLSSNNIVNREPFKDSRFEL